MAAQAKPGQFISVYTKDGAKLLPRPISICETNKETGMLRIVYRTVGAGTEEFSRYQAGDTVDIMGPLGNGFPLEEAAEGKTAFLIGGGIGIPPMLELAKQLHCKKEVILGYRDVLFLNEEFAPYGEVVLATEDGSAGTKGNVIDAIREHGLKADVIFACGPTPMLRALKAYAAAFCLSRRRWPAESAHVWPAYARQRTWTNTPRFTMRESVKTGRYFGQRR